MQVVGNLPLTTNVARAVVNISHPMISTCTCWVNCSWCSSGIPHSAAVCAKDVRYTLVNGEHSLIGSCHRISNHLCLLVCCIDSYYKKKKIFSEKQEEFRDGLSYSTPQKSEKTRENAITQPRSHPITKCGRAWLVTHARSQYRTEELGRIWYRRCTPTTHPSLPTATHIALVEQLLSSP